MINGLEEKKIDKISKKNYKSTLSNTWKKNEIFLSEEKFTWNKSFEIGRKKWWLEKSKKLSKIFYRIYFLIGFNYVYSTDFYDSWRDRSDPMITVMRVHYSQAHVSFQLSDIW